MRHVMKSLVAGISGGLTVLMLALSFAPATPNEAAALGPYHDRMDRVQMRLANAMMTVAPDFTVARMAAAAELPEDVVREQLTAKAEGRDPFAEPNPLAQETAAADTGRRIDAGGALFVRAN